MRTLSIKKTAYSFFAITFMLGSQGAFAKINVKAFYGTNKRFSTNLNGPTQFGAEVGIDDTVEKVNLGLGGSLNQSEANGYLNDGDGNPMEKQHLVYAFADYSVLPMLSVGLQAGLAIYQENYTNDSSPFVITKFKTESKYLTAGLRIGTKVAVTENLSVGSLSTFSYLGEKNNPAFLIANSLVLGAEF
jgi:hypothetical protein